MAIFCTDCGKEIPEGVAFCTQCGTKAPSDSKAEAALCGNCKAVMPEGVAFCTQCGAPRNSDPAAEGKAPPTPFPQVQTQAQVQPPPQVQTQAQVQPPPQAQAQPRVQTQGSPAAADPRTKVVGTGTFFGLHFLFSIPIIGWLVCLIMAFAPKNQNLKHYARAVLIWTLISMVLLLGLFFLFQWLGGVLMGYLNEAFGGSLGEFGELFEQFGEFGDVMDQIQSGGLEGLPTDF